MSDKQRRIGGRMGIMAGKAIPVRKGSMRNRAVAHQIALLVTGQAEFPGIVSNGKRIC